VVNPAAIGIRRLVQGAVESASNVARPTFTRRSLTGTAVSIAKNKNPHGGSRKRSLCHDFVTASTMRREVGDQKMNRTFMAIADRPRLIATFRRENEVASVFENAFHQATRQGLE